MNERKSALRTCKQDHQYHKSTDYPICPPCENERKPKDSFFAKIGAPARRALEKEKISSLQQLAQYSDKELLKLHGIGPSAIRILKVELEKNDLKFL